MHCLCLNIIKPTMTSQPISFREELRIKRIKFEECDSNRFTRLQWSSSRLLHAFFRLFMFIYALSWFAVDLKFSLHANYFIYVSHWCQIVMILYFGFSIFVMVLSYCNKRHDSLRWYHVITWILLNIYVTMAVSVTIAYWIGIWAGFVSHKMSVISINVHVHVIIALLAIIEVTLNDLPIRILHFYCPAIFAFIYVMFTLVLHWCDVTSAIYPVLDWKEPTVAVCLSVALVFIAIPAVHVVITYGIYRLRAYLRTRIFHECCATNRKDSAYTIHV